MTPYSRIVFHMQDATILASLSKNQVDIWAVKTEWGWIRPDNALRSRNYVGTRLDDVGYALSVEPGEIRPQSRLGSPWKHPQRMTVIWRWNTTSIEDDYAIKTRSGWNQAGITLKTPSEDDRDLRVKYDVDRGRLHYKNTLRVEPGGIRHRSEVGITLKTPWGYHVYTSYFFVHFYFFKFLNF